MLQNEQTFQSFLLYWMEIRRKRCSAHDGMLNSKCYIWYIYNYFTSVRLPIHPGVHNIEQQVCSNNVERKYIQEQQQNQIHCYNQNMGFVNTMDQRAVNYSIDIQMKKWCWFPFVWMVDVVLQGARLFYRIDKDEGDESLPFKTCC